MRRKDLDRPAADELTDKDAAFEDLPHMQVNDTDSDTDEGDDIGNQDDSNDEEANEEDHELDENEKLGSEDGEENFDKDPFADSNLYAPLQPLAWWSMIMQADVSCM